MRKGEKKIMKRENALVVSVLCLFLVLSISAMCWAASYPSELVVVRAADNSLWKAMCTASSCTAFSGFPGMFASTPTVLWDELMYKYVIWGRATDGSIWRATFDYVGTFNDDWVSIPGSTPSQIGAIGSTFKYPYVEFAKSSNIGVSNISTDCGNMTNLTQVSTNPPAPGYALYASTDGIYAPTTVNKWVRVCLSTSSGGGACDSLGPYLESSSIAGYEGEKRFALNLTIASPAANTTYHWYLKACRETGATGTLMWDRLISNIGF